MRAFEREIQDKAGRQYWDRGYQELSRNPPFDPHSPKLRAFWKRGLHRYFAQVLGSMGADQSLVEIGCGDSRMLGYFAREFGFQVTGVDYSETGCDQARLNLTEEKVSGKVICADLFAPPAELLGTFDVLVSFGVVEHFSDTAACLRALERFLKPGGLLITTVPNMSGLVGTCQRILDRDVFDKHVRLDKETLERAHAEAGLCVKRCEYLLFANFAVVNINEARIRDTRHWPRLAALKALRAATAVSWALETALRPGRPNRLTSPYVACVAVRERARSIKRAPITALDSGKVVPDSGLR